MAIKSRYKLKTGEEVAYFPPIQNTDNPYLTEAAMHADQAKQLKGYVYVVSDVGHFEYKGGASGTAADYELISGSKSREIKKITNTTQFTILPEHFTDYILVFTADANEEISLIMPAGISAIEGKVIALSEGNHTLIPTAETGIILAQTDGSKMRTKGKGSKIEILPTTTAGVFAVTGDLAILDITGKDIKLRSPDTESSIFFYDNETTVDRYFELKYDAGDNIFAISSKDSPTDPEVYAMFFDRGKDFAVTPGYLRSLSKGYGLILQSPDGDTNFKNPSDNIGISATNNSIRVSKINILGDDKILWESNLSGTTAERPDSTTHDLRAGFPYFDTDLGKPIWWDGTQWVEYSSGVTGSIYEKIKIENLSSGDTVTINRNDNKPVHYLLLGEASTSPVTIEIDPSNLCEKIIITTLLSSGQAIFYEHLSDVNYLAANGSSNTIKTGGTVNLNKTADWDLPNTYSITGDLAKEFEVKRSPDGTLYKVGVANDGTRTSTPL